MRRLSISLMNPPAITVTRVSTRQQRICYLIVANKVMKYPNGRSKVVYIGTTQNGVHRLASSAAYWADAVLGGHGTTQFEIRVVRCSPRQGVKTWRKLERALLLTFRDLYGDLPRFNTQASG
jgi:hypothetical protein